MKSTSKKSGFTLLETILAIAVVALAITASVQLTITSIRISGSAMDKFMAHHLAEEGLEITRNIRDGNWLQNVPWTNGLTPGKYVISENTGGLTAGHKWVLNEGIAPEGAQIRLGENKIFSRVIEISSPDETVMKITSTVTYGKGAVPKTVSLSSELTDWKKGPL